MVDKKVSAYLLVGSERYLKDRAIDELKASLLKGASHDVDSKVFYGEEANARDVLDYAATIPFASNMRFVMIKNFEKMSEEDRSKIAVYIKGAPRFACFILDTDDERIAREYGLMGRNAAVLRFKDLSEDELAGWIRQYLSSRDKVIETEALEVLKERGEKDLLSLIQELEKLTAYTKDKKEISSRDVESLVGRSLERSGFDIAWAIGEGRSGDAIELAHDLIMTGKRPHEIMGILSWHFRRLGKAKLLQSKGAADYSIVNILKVRRLDTDKFFKQARSHSLDRIRSMMDVCLEADLDIKRARFDPAMLLEFAIIRLCLI